MLPSWKIHETELNKDIKEFETLFNKTTNYMQKVTERAGTVVKIS